MAQRTIATRDGLPTTLSRETVAAFRERLSGPLLSPEDDGFEEATWLWNGMIDKAPALAVQPETADDAVIGNRDFQYGLGILGIRVPVDPAGDEHRAWIREAWKQCRPFSTGRHYVNFETADEPGHRTRTDYCDNYDRLVEAKTEHDPGTLFRTNVNVSSDPEAGAPEQE